MLPRRIPGLVRPCGLTKLIGVGPAGVLFHSRAVSSNVSSNTARSNAPLPRKPVTVDVELPDVLAGRNKGRNSFMLFCVIMGVSFWGIVKYEDASAPVVSSTLYTLRRSPKAREALGPNIMFASLMPWVSGSVAVAAGVVDFSYSVKGDKAKATARFSSRRNPATRRFEVLDWSLTLDNGEVISLMEEEFHPFVPGPKDEPTRRASQVA